MLEGEIRAVVVITGECVGVAEFDYSVVMGPSLQVAVAEFRKRFYIPNSAESHGRLIPFLDRQEYVTV